VKRPFLLFHLNFAFTAYHNGHHQAEKFDVDTAAGHLYRQHMKRYIVITVLLSLFLLACGSDYDPNKVTIVWWQFWTDAGIKPVIQSIIADFESMHPGVTVKLVDLTWADGHDKIAVAFSSSGGPDVVELGSDWVAEFSSTNHLADITTQVEPMLDDYMKWAPVEYGGKYYGMPWILGTRVLFANTDLLRRAGYAADYMPQTWDDLLEASVKLNTLGGGTFGFGSNSAERHRLYKKFLPFLWSNGGAILSKDGKHCLLDEPAAIEALEYYIKLCKNGVTDSQRRLEDAFLQGKIGFIISGDWLLKRFDREKPNIHFNTGLIPGPDGLASSSSFAGGEYLVVNENSEHKNEAFQLIKYICMPEMQLRFCTANRTANPSSKSAATDSVFLSHPHFDTFNEQIKKAKMPPINPQWVYMEDILEKAIEAALYETKTPQAAFGEAKIKIEELIAQ